MSQLARAVRLSQSCTTRHLQALERAGLVKGWRDGKRVVFRPEPRDAEAVAVIGSLTGAGAGAALAGKGGRLAGTGRAPLASRLTSRKPQAIPVASTAELEPLPAAREADEAERAERAPRGPAPESDISPPAQAPRRHWSEIEDYLL